MEANNQSVLCPRCGYDLRAHPQNANCPECEASVAESQRLAAIPTRPAWRDSDPRWRRCMLEGVWILVMHVRKPRISLDLGQQCWDVLPGQTHVDGLVAAG